MDENAWKGEDEYRWKRQFAQAQGELYKKLNVGDDQNKFVAYASLISNNDLDFITTLEAENGLWTHDRIGITGDIGFCQFAPQYHSDVTNDPRFYSDPYWQLDQCWEHYQEGTRFYGYDLRKNHYNKFKLQ